VAIEEEEGMYKSLAIEKEKETKQLVKVQDKIRILRCKKT